MDVYCQKLAGDEEDLIGTEAYEVKLFVGQVALEWTVVSLLSSLVLKNPEPLLKKILQRIKFSVFSP